MGTLIGVNRLLRIGGPFRRCPYDKSQTISGSKLGAPDFLETPVQGLL